MHISTGFYRLVLESSDDGLGPWHRQIVAHGDDAFEIAGELRARPDLHAVCDCPKAPEQDGTTVIDPFDDFAAPFCPWCGDRDTAKAWHDRTQCLAAMIADPERGTEAEVRDRPDPLPRLAMAVRPGRLRGRINETADSWS